MLLNYEIWNTFYEILNENFPEIFYFWLKLKYKYIYENIVLYKFLK